MSVAIHIDKVIKRYGPQTVIPGLSADIKNGEFFTLLGPSGCGKTTLLRMVAGFNSIEGGTIRFDEQVMNDIPAYQRNIGMVFQSYAIFPHLTVRENIEYGLKDPLLLHPPPRSPPPPRAAVATAAARLPSPPPPRAAVASPLQARG